MRAQLAVAVVAMAMITACGKDEGTAKLAFDGATPNGLTFQPVNFKMKLIAAYLTEDVDHSAGGNGSNIGITSRFYENPACAGDLKHCDISAGTGEDGQPIDKIVNDFFDFSPSADVNAALNAQANPVEATSYKYVRLEFCKYNAGGAANVQWGGSFSGHTVTNAEYNASQCGADSAEIVPPLVIGAGDAATVTLSYSTVGLVSDTGGTGPNCVSAGGSTYCFTLPTFTPAAQLN